MNITIMNLKETNVYMIVFLNYSEGNFILLDHWFKFCNFMWKTKYFRKDKFKSPKKMLTKMPWQFNK